MQGDLRLTFAEVISVRDTQWFKFKVEGGHIWKAAEQHLNAHRAVAHQMFHGTTPNAGIQIIGKTGGLRQGSIHGNKSHAPWCVLGTDQFETSAAGTYQQGVIIEATAWGVRTNYTTAGKTMRACPDTVDWREDRTALYNIL